MERLLVDFAELIKVYNFLYLIDTKEHICRHSLMIQNPESDDYGANLLAHQ
jgi:hypothetical protein